MISKWGSMKVLSALLVILVVTCAFPALAQPCPPTSWCSGTYQYDGMGNIRAIGNDTYIYDTAGRLVSGTADVQRTGVMSRQEYAYDAFGNRTSASRALGSVDCLGGCEQSLTIDPATNHITSNGSAYDAAGNLISITNTVNGISFTSTFDYDGTGSMTHATASSGDDRQFIYTADGERIAVKNGQSWTWTVRSLDGKVVREFTSAEQNGLPTANWLWAKDYVWRDGLLLATVAPTTPGATTTVTRHFHLDHLGTPRLVTDDNGVKIGIHAYYPFGAELNLSPNEQPSELMKFTGHERDLLASNPNTLDYMHARYDMATMGRFLSIDPVLDQKSVLRNPQAWNRYAYVRNNPLRLTDPTGKYTCEGSRQDCATVKTAYNDLRLAAANLPRNSADRNRINNALTFLGRPGQANGVRVTVGSGTIAGAAGGTSTTTHAADIGPTGYTTQIGLNLANMAAALGGRNQPAFAPEVAAALGHEAQHGIDQRLEGMPTNRAQALRGEINAFTTDAAVYRGLNFESGWQVWTRANGFDAQAVQRAAEQSTQDWCNAGGNCQ